MTVSDMSFGQLYTAYYSGLGGLTLATVDSETGELTNIGDLGGFRIGSLAWIPIVPFGPNISRFFPYRIRKSVRWQLYTILASYPN